MFTAGQEAPLALLVGREGEVAVTSTESQPKKVARRDRVAIVGFAGTSRHLAPYDDKSVEIWGLNEAHRQPWMRRITRWFQIHQRWDFTKQNNESYRDHWEWLQKEQPFPIYMIEKAQDIPSSVEFPLEEICEKFLSNVRRGKDWKEAVINKYFTSSFAYMCSMALYEGFKRIEIYGFEMATDTEYRYQKGSTEFWIGLAAGLGVEVLVTEDCQLVQGKLYGYEVSRMINRQRLEFLQNRFKHELKIAEVDLAKINGRRQENDRLYNDGKGAEVKKTYAIRGRELLEAEINAMGTMAEKRGRLGMITDLIKVVDNMQVGKDDWQGPEGDQNPKVEDERQRQAEATAQKQEPEPVPAELSEG